VPDSAGKRGSPLKIKRTLGDFHSKLGRQWGRGREAQWKRKKKSHKQKGREMGLDITRIKGQSKLKRLVII